VIWISLVLAVLSALAAIAAGILAYRGRTKLEVPPDGTFTVTVADGGFAWTLALTISSALLVALSAVFGALATLVAA
jgi:hypothetical protein